MRCTRWFALAAVLTCPPGRGFAQVPNYLEHLPAPVPIINETRASARFRIYDVAGSEQLNPRFADRLRTLAVEFSPVLKANNHSVPREIWMVMAPPGEAAVLVAETWNTGPYHPVSVGREFVPLRVMASGGSSSGGIERAGSLRLVALIDRFGPRAARTNQVRPESASATVLYIDFPGGDSKTWREAYRYLPRTDSRIYAHFFVHEEPLAAAPAGAMQPRYRFVIQYWFFYPFNDGVNNHEGDWEHLNVHVTTAVAANRRRQERSLLNAEEVSRLLDGRTPFDSLIIGRVDYYFHHFAHTVDYVEQGAYGSERIELLGGDYTRLARSAPAASSRQGTHWITDRLRRLLELRAQGTLTAATLNRHPVGFIGGNSVGLDQLITFPGGRNQNSHGTFAFPGTWKRVGPAGATERVSENPDELRDHFRRASQDPAEWCGSRLEGDVYLCYGSPDIVILPDWEYVRTSNTTTRNEWFWLLLPIRWGYPVSYSVGTGVLRHTDLGDAAPVGPAYNKGWNRIGSNAGYDEFTPHVIPPAFQTGMQDGFTNSFGFLNAAIATALLPPAWLIYMPVRSIVGDRKFSTTADVPFRFLSMRGGAARLQSLGNTRLLMPSFDPEAIPEQYRFTDTFLPFDDDFEPHGIGPAVALAYHLGTFTSEVSYSRVEGRLGYEWLSLTEARVQRRTLEADYTSTELLGTIRITPLRDGFQPFVQGGWGWNHTRVDNYRWHVFDRDREDPRSQPTTATFALPGSEEYDWNLWPNVWHLGFGLEVMRTNRTIHEFFGAPELGLHLGYRYRWRRIPNPGSSKRLWVPSRTLDFGLVLAF